MIKSLKDSMKLENIDEQVEKSINLNLDYTKIFEIIEKEKQKSEQWFNEIFKKEKPALDEKDEALSALMTHNMLLKEQIHIFDNFIFSGIKRIRTEPLTIVFKFITFFCSTEFLLIATIAIMVFSKNKKRAFYIALNVLICFLLNHL